jgi:hypothetical protein
MYFTITPSCQHYPDEWEALLNYIKSAWTSNNAAHLGDLVHQIEAKSLYVFTLSRHLIESAESLPVNGNWRPVFVEASILLFPMLELVGEARMGNKTHTSSWRRLASGIDWLIDPLVFPTRSIGTSNSFSADVSRINTLGRYMQTLPSGPKVRELYHLRNYFTHGLKNQGDPRFDIGAVQTCMNYELPQAVIQQAKSGLAIYWKQLRNEDRSGSIEWVTRLAEADIYPFGIIGSDIYDKGLIDPDIIYWIDALDK